MLLVPKISVLEMESGRGLNANGYNPGNNPCSVQHKYNSIGRGRPHNSSMISETRIRNYQRNLALKRNHPVDADDEAARRERWKKLNLALAELQGRFDSKLEQLPYKEGPKVTMASSTPRIWEKLEKARQQLLARQEKPTFEDIKMQLSKNFQAAGSSEVAAALNILKLDDPEDCASFGAHVDKVLLEAAR